MGRPRKTSASLPPSSEGEPGPEGGRGATEPGPEGGKKRGRPASRPSSSASGDLAKSPSRKRGRTEAAEERPPLQLAFRHERGAGVVLTVGQGDTGQLGLGEDVMEKLRPQLVGGIAAKAVDVAAGGMHTAVLDVEGVVWTFGCNDEGSLGRVVEEEEECFLPGRVALPAAVAMISCGDSHTAAVTREGAVWAWGTFRDSSGPIGLVAEGRLEKEPVAVLPGVQVVRIASGSDHLVMLTRDGELYSMGNAEQGQLGRIMEKFAHRGGRRGLETFLKPDKIHIKSRFGAFTSVWAGSYNTVAVTKTGEVMVCGLNNYNQMGIADGLTFYMPVVSRDLSKHRWDGVAIGQHHALGQAEGGAVLALGRSEYGRLGLGEEGAADAKMAAVVPGVAGCIEVACGTAVSYAVTGEGKLYSWGMGTNGQLGTGEEEDVWEPFLVNSKQLKDRKVIAVSSGGQHTVMIAQDKEEEVVKTNGTAETNGADMEVN